MLKDLSAEKLKQTNGPKETKNENENENDKENVNVQEVEMTNQ